MFEARYIETVRSIFQEQKQLAEDALKQVNDEDMHRAAHLEQHEVALDRFFDDGRREAGPKP